MTLSETDMRELLDRAGEEWNALGLMSYTGDQPDLSPTDIEAIRSLVHDLADGLESLHRERGQLQAALTGLLDVFERSRRGDPTLDPEEWYAHRDFARSLVPA